MYTAKDIVGVFEFKPANDDRVIKHEDVRASVIDLALTLNSILPEGEEKKTAIERLREVMFWSNAAVACESPVGNGKTRN